MHVPCPRFLLQLSFTAVDGRGECCKHDAGSRSGCIKRKASSAYKALAHLAPCTARLCYQVVNPRASMTLSAWAPSGYAQKASRITTSCQLHRQLAHCDAILCALQNMRRNVNLSMNTEGHALPVACVKTGPENDTCGAYAPKTLKGAGRAFQSR